MGLLKRLAYKKYSQDRWLKEQVKIQKQNLELARDHYERLIDETLTKLDKINHFKAISFPMSEKCQLIIDYEPSFDIETTLSFIVDQIRLGLEKQNLEREKRFEEREKILETIGEK